MNPSEPALVELLHMAPTPLYPAYRWLVREVDAGLELGAFLTLLDGMLKREVVELWSTEDGTERQLDAVPAGLDARYAGVALDPTYDPFRYTLTVGPAAAPPTEEPQCELEVDFKAGTFVAEWEAGADPQELERMFGVYERRRFVERRRVQEGTRTRVEGVVVED